jgi:hypothetical protein
LEKGGIFENDPSLGNIIQLEDDTIKLFDFGYAYRFDPLEDYNSDGRFVPVFTVAERFETRAFFPHLFDIETELGFDKAFSLFSLEKEVVLEFFLDRLRGYQVWGAKEEVISYFKTITDLWDKGLSNESELQRLYKMEFFRSFLIDVHDDISGKTCTPDTKVKAETILSILNNEFVFLKDNNVFFWGDEDLSKSELQKKYQNYIDLTIEYQIPLSDEF